MQKYYTRTSATVGMQTNQQAGSFLLSGGNPAPCWCKPEETLEMRRRRATGMAIGSSQTGDVSKDLCRASDLYRFCSSSRRAA